MRYLGLALFAEGITDHRFLAPILRRVTEDLCLQLASDIVEIGEVVELRTPAQHRGKDRETRILGAAREARGAYGILFIHTEASGSGLSTSKRFLLFGILSRIFTPLFLSSDILVRGYDEPAGPTKSDHRI